MKKKIGVYAGSFNPFHVGHMDVLLQAREVFDEVIVATGVNPEKPKAERDPLKCLDGYAGVKVQAYNGLLSDYLNQLDLNDDCEVFLVRGLRNGEDLQYEQNQIQFIKAMYPSLRVVFFICAKNVEHISSKALRALKEVSVEEYEKYTF